LSINTLTTYSRLLARGMRMTGLNMFAGREIKSLNTTFTALNRRNQLKYHYSNLAPHGGKCDGGCMNVQSQSSFNEKTPIALIHLMCIFVLLQWGCSTPTNPKSDPEPEPVGETHAAVINPPEVREVAFDTVQSGSMSGLARRGRVVIRNQEEWTLFWKRHSAIRRPIPEAPEIDFSKNMVLAVMMGQQSSGGYTIEITSVKQKEGKMMVEVRETDPSKSTTTLSALTAPFHIVTVPKWEGEIVFSKFEQD